MPTIHHRASLEMVGTLSLCPPYGLRTTDYGLAHALSTSLRAQRSNPSFCTPGGNGLLRCARNDDVEAMPPLLGSTGKSLLIFRNHVKPENQKYSAFVLTQISGITLLVSLQMRGDRERHERAVRCDGRRWRARRTRLMRTVKSRGSGAAVLALSLR